jgi:hypothetical protein
MTVKAIKIANTKPAISRFDPAGLRSISAIAANTAGIMAPPVGWVVVASGLGDLLEDFRPQCLSILEETNRHDFQARSSDLLAASKRHPQSFLNHCHRQRAANAHPSALF